MLDKLWRKNVKKVIIFCLIFLTLFLVFAEKDTNSPKAKEAKKLVEDGIKYFKKNGLDKTMEEISKSDSRFTEGEFYLFAVRLDGITVGHGGNSGLVGKNMLEIRDPDGKYFMKEFLTIAKEKGSGWVNYRWSHPVTNKIAPKQAFIKMIPGTDIFIGCGFYE